MKGDEIIDGCLAHLGITAADFAKRLGFERPQVIYDIQKGKTKNISNSMADKIVAAFPEFNRVWLMTGEGDMLRPVQTVGDITNSNVSGVNVNGKEIHINPDAYNTLLKIVEANQKTTEKFQEQIDRLITIIEAKYGTARG